LSISPLQFLAVLIGLTAVARLTFILRRQRHRRALHALAKQWQMHYSPHDRFDLAARVAERFPIPGAAEMHVVDLIYGRQGDAYRYVFTAEYTIGVTHGKHRHRRVVTFREPKGVVAPGHEDWSTVTLGDEHDEVVEQYLSIGEKITMKDEG
jgi:hypothetical protein